MNFFNYYVFGSTLHDKVAFLVQFPILSIIARLTRRKPFEMRFMVPVNHHHHALGFFLENPRALVPDWFGNLDFSRYTGKTFLDIGSNLGYFSAYFFQKTREMAFAFDINPQVITLLDAAIEKSPLEGKIIVIKDGLSNREGMLFLHVDRPYSPLATTDTSNKEKMETVFGVSFHSKIQVKVSKLDQVASTIDFSNVGLIKVDVEGTEREVLEGGIQTIRKYLPDIIFEANSTEKKKSVEHFLVKLGYSIYPLNINNWLARPQRKAKRSTLKKAARK